MRLSILAVVVGSILLAASVATCRAAAAPSNASKPNILVLLADDVGWKDFGCYGHPTIRTPHIDHLAQGGLRFTHAFLTTSQCSPTRISVLTGKYPHATGAEDLHMPLPPDQKFVSSYLRQAGYFTGHMRKTHYGREGARQFDWYSKQLEDFPKFLDAAAGRPFFLWVGFFDAHRPYQPNTIEQPHRPADVVVPPFLADTPETRADLARYYDEVGRMDQHIGQFVETLRRRGLLESTCIVFFSDNGRPFPRCKGTVYDSGIGTPLIFHWPAQIAAAQVCDSLVSVVDLAPTWLALAGVPIPDDMQGRSLLNLLQDPSRPGRQYVFAERNWHDCDEHIRAVRSRQFKLIHNAYTDRPFGSPADVSGSPSWMSLKRLYEAGKLSPAQAALFRVPRPEWELYDLRHDPDELHNVANQPQYATTLRQFQNELRQWERQTGDFPPERRQRDDNTDRRTGKKIMRRVPPLRNP